MLIERRNSRRLMNQINVVPYIDVMLVLLVIFMVTAPMVNPGQVDLPSIGKSSHPSIAPMEVSVRADESLWLRDRSMAGGDEVRVDRARLVQAIKEKQQKNPEQAVVSARDTTVRRPRLSFLTQISKQEQVAKVGLLAKPR